jgi:hypothetical protein
MVLRRREDVSLFVYGNSGSAALIILAMTATYARSSA